MKKYCIFTVADKHYVNQLHVMLNMLHGENANISDLDIDYYVYSDTLTQDDLKLDYFNAKVVTVPLEDLHPLGLDDNDQYGRYIGARYIALNHLTQQYEYCLQLDLDLVVNSSIREIFTEIPEPFVYRAIKENPPDYIRERGFTYLTNAGVIMFKSAYFKQLDMAQTYKREVVQHSGHTLARHPRYDEFMMPNIVNEEYLDVLPTAYNQRSFGNEFINDQRYTTEDEKIRELTLRRKATIAHMKTKAWDNTIKHCNTFPFDLYFKEVEKVKHIISDDFYERCKTSAEQTITLNDIKKSK